MASLLEPLLLTPFRRFTPVLKYFDIAAVNALFTKCTIALEHKGQLFYCDIARLHQELTLMCDPQLLVDDEVRLLGLSLSCRSLRPRVVGRFKLKLKCS